MPDAQRDRVWDRLPGSASLDSRGLLVSGRRVPLIGAEFHFWRQQADFWAASLTAIKSAGIEIVSTFICWSFHELEAGSFDFRGTTRPERDLVSFLELCAEMELLVILRPGPIIDAEWETRGPGRDVCTLERNDPRFLVRAGQYLRALADVAAPYQVTRGGPIVLVAVDNEIFFPYASDPSWHAEDGDVLIEYKRDFVRQRWHDWLPGRFEDVENLNRALGTTYAEFDALEVPRLSSATRTEIGLVFEFIDAYCADYLRHVVEVLREGGIEVPLYTNQKQFLAYLDWATVGAPVDSVGLNICMPDMVPGAQALAVSWFVRMQRARAGFPWSPEYQAGWIGFDELFGVISPQHGLYMGLLGGALGLRGMSFFMFIERDDWNWSPVNSFGKVRPTRFQAYRQLVSVMRALEPDRQLASVGLLWSLSEHREHMAATTEGWEDLFKHWMELEEAKEPPRWWATFQALHEVDADFRLVDLASDPRAWPQFVIYAGDGTLGAEERERLGSALSAGTVLVAVGRVPKPLGNGEGVHAATPATAWSVATGAGASSYVHAGTGLWSFAYAERHGCIVVFVLNPTADVLHASLGGELVHQGDRWFDLLSQTQGRGNLGAAIETGGAVFAPKTARVIRMFGAAEPD